GRVSERNVCAYRAVEQHIFLQHDAQLPTQPGGVDDGKVDAVHQHAPTLRYVEPLGKLGERALAGARGADDANDLTGRHAKTDVMQHFRPIHAVAEGDMPEADSP